MIQLFLVKFTQCSFRICPYIGYFRVFVEHVLLLFISIRIVLLSSYWLLCYSFLMDFYLATWKCFASRLHSHFFILCILRCYRRFRRLKASRSAFFFSIIRFDHPFDFFEFLIRPGSILLSFFTRIIDKSFQESVFVQGWLIFEREIV